MLGILYTTKCRVSEKLECSFGALILLANYHATHPDCIALFTSTTSINLIPECIGLLQILLDKDESTVPIWSENLISQHARRCTPYLKTQTDQDFNLEPPVFNQLCPVSTAISECAYTISRSSKNSNNVGSMRNMSGQCAKLKSYVKRSVCVGKSVNTYFSLIKIKEQK